MNIEVKDWRPTGRLSDSFVRGLIELRDDLDAARKRREMRAAAPPALNCSIVPFGATPRSRTQFVSAYEPAAMSAGDRRQAKG